ncbi:MAG: DUF2029 domain-containing protein [Anaerolineales bacterium]|nr:DUF2029 domain-containing protein [Anaerolineales bacterium]
MKPTLHYLTIALLAILGIATLASLIWVNYQYSVQNPGGSDFLPRWVGTREFIMKGQSPYSEETTREIQQRFYGRPARPDEDQALFVYPFYSIFVFAPFALIPDFNLARAVWMTVLEVSIILIAIMGISFSRWKLSPAMLGALLAFAILWYYSIRPLINSNASILVGLFIAGAILAIRAEQDSWAGLLLALATIKPQVVALLILFVLIWSVSERRYIIVWSFLGNLALMIAVTSLLIPDWDLAECAPDLRLSQLHAGWHARGDLRRVDARRGPSARIRAHHAVGCHADLGVARGAGEGVSLVSVDRVFHPHRHHPGWHSHRDGKLHRHAAGGHLGLRRLGSGMG